MGRELGADNDLIGSRKQEAIVCSSFVLCGWEMTTWRNVLVGVKGEWTDVTFFSLIW